MILHWMWKFRHPSTLGIPENSTPLPEDEMFEYRSDVLCPHVACRRHLPNIEINEEATKYIVTFLFPWVVFNLPWYFFPINIIFLDEVSLAELKPSICPLSLSSPSRLPSAPSTDSMFLCSKYNFQRSFRLSLAFFI